MDNLRLAFHKAQRGKAARTVVIAFRRSLEANLRNLREDLLAGRFSFDGYTRFPIFDPKPREICAAPFPSRVVQHAVMNVCEPVFERYQIADSYACRKGRGLDRCLERTRAFCARFDCYLRCDVHKYFDSISHDILLEWLGRHFKDARLMDLFRAVIASHAVRPGRGLPIGNLTSQYFANAYLGMLDHRVKNELSVRGYVRYMDDFCLFSDSRDDLARWRAEVTAFCSDALRLELNAPQSNRTAAGLHFLGYVVRGGGLRLTLRSKRNFVRRIRAANRCEAVQSAEALCAFAARADTIGFRRKVIFGTPIEGSNRVNRGGGWNSNARNCRSANRDRNSPGNRNNNLGFRVALAPSSRTRRMPINEQIDDPVVPLRHDENPGLRALVDVADATAERPRGPSSSAREGA